jgi:DNA-binding MarR family transcriptional regulator
MARQHDTAADGTVDESRRLPASWPTGRLLSALNRRVEREWNTHLAHWDLNHASLPVLAHLAGGPRSQRELAVACGVTEQTMSKTVARLERTGYVDRPTRPADRRRHDVVLTAAGTAALRAAGDHRTAEAMVLRGLDEAQVDQLRALLLLMMAGDEPLGNNGPADPADEESTG